MTHQAINELITASRTLIRNQELAERFHALANAAEAELKAIPTPHTHHLIAGHRVILDYRGTVEVADLTYSVALLAGDLITKPGHWVQIRREGGALVVREATDAAIRKAPPPPQCPHGEPLNGCRDCDREHREATA